MHQVASQLQCPQVSASFGDYLDFSSFSVLLDQPENLGDDRNSSALSGGAPCKLLLYSISLVNVDLFISIVKLQDQVGPERINIWWCSYI